MSDRFVLHSSNEDTSLELEGPIPEGLTGYDGCTFLARVKSHRLDASVDVDDVRPYRWADFFAGLVENWRGWSGERSHESLEHHLRITARIDRAGHVSFDVALRDDDLGIQLTIHSEAGQLARFARLAREYFGSCP